jgi:hypothetical protein
MELIYWQLSRAEANMTKVWTIVVSSVTAGSMKTSIMLCYIAHLQTCFGKSFGKTSGRVLDCAYYM